MDAFTQSIVKAQKDFLVEEPYDYKHEFVGRKLSSGTYMPLTLYCNKLDLRVYFRYGRSRYAGNELMVKGDYELTNLGKLKYRILKEMDDFERTTCGTIGCWGLRYNERRRQLQAVESRSLHRDWKVLRENYIKNLERNLTLYELLFDLVIEELVKLEDDLERLQHNIERHIAEHNKSQIRIITTEMITYSYLLTGRVNLKEMISEYIKFIRYIKSNLYSKKRLNYRYILSALRNRPLEIKSISETQIDGFMDRSREANGQPPLSLGWMLLDDVKDMIVSKLFDKIESIYKIKFIDPTRDKDFYWKFTHWVKGLYLFGDNGKVVYGKKDSVNYDLSISDVFQGFMRRSYDGENLSFFQRLNGDFDCGSTGGLVTFLWNLDGQGNLWECFNEGLLSTKEEWPEVKDLSEETDTFVGHYYNYRMRRWMSKGLRLTTDDARRSISLTIPRGDYRFLTLQQKKAIPANEFAQLLTTSGFGKLRLRDFYDWVRSKRNLKISPEDYGMQARVGGLLVDQEIISDFMDKHSVRQLEILSKPLNLKF